MRLRLTILLCLTTLGLAACETIKGAGRDIQTTGRTIERAVQ